jgi:hypothetical protein
MWESLTELAVFFGVLSGAFLARVKTWTVAVLCVEGEINPRRVAL